MKSIIIRPSRPSLFISLFILLLSLSQYILQVTANDPILTNPVKFFKSSSSRYTNDPKLDLEAINYFNNHTTAVEYQPKLFLNLKRKVLYFRTEADNVYRIGKFIASGANGIVNEAFRIGKNGRVLEKLVVKRPLDDMDSFHELIAEVQGSKLHSPNRYKDFLAVTTESGTRSYAVFEFLNGRNLDSVLRDQVFTASSIVFMRETILDFMEQLASTAKAELWDKGMSHGDFRAANIMVEKFYSKNSSLRKIHFIDFGRAQVTENNTPITLRWRLYDMSYFFFDFIQYLEMYERGSQNSRFQKPIQDALYGKLMQVVKTDLWRWVYVFLQEESALDAKARRMLNNHMEEHYKYAAIHNGVSYHRIKSYGKYLFEQKKKPQ